MSTIQADTSEKRELSAALPAVCIIRWHHTLICGIYVSLFLFFAYLPVAHPATWNAVSIGAAEWQATVSLPLSDGMRQVDVSWMGDRMISMLYAMGGVESLSFASAVLQIAVLACWSIVFVRLTGRWWAALAAILVALTCFPYLCGLSSGLFGQLMLALLALIFTSRVRGQRSSGGMLEIQWIGASRWSWSGVCGLFCLWSNLDASFVIGLGWLASIVVARSIVVLNRQGLTHVMSDSELRARVWLLEIAAIATLVNPVGTHLWASMFWWPDNPFLYSIGGLQATAMSGWVGACVMILWGTFMVVSRRRVIPMTWLLYPIAMTIAVAVCSPLIVFFAPLMLTAILSTLGNQGQQDDLVKRIAGGVDQTKQNPEPSQLRFAATLVACLFVWIGFSFSPWGSTLLGGPMRTQTQLVGSQLPLSALNHLRGHTMKGVLLCPSPWSDWLEVQLGVPVFVNSDAGRIPASVLSDYEQIIQGESGWGRIAEKYALQELLIDKHSQRQLVRRIRQGSGSWTIVYEDSQVIHLSKES
ncbi:hypothetical protein [Stieleria varia]|uniref:Glycosyltransferase RgtA/B/C/D-like domain-containing protein n=1 Tax=Stieleria varia TaxID=2528005 RepID=A0A5C6B3G3_9BACT|nr:hypothetical protein [Stieleria varia]TWU06072.1 hypothetical protein Pla52n_17920 [Stieleria varia]